MGLLYRKHLAKDSFTRVTLAFGKKTFDYTNQLAVRYKLLKGQALSRILEDFISDSKLQSEFKKYSEDFLKTDDDKLEYEFIEKDGALIPKIHHTNFEIPAAIVDRINKMMFDFRFVDRNRLIRTLIHFFHDKNFNESLIKQSDELKMKVTALGYKVISSGVIDGELYVRIEKSVL